MDSNLILTEKDYLTDLRFLSTKTEANRYFAILREKPEVDKEELKKIIFEDETYLIKFETYKKNKKKIVFWIILSICGIILAYLDINSGYIIAGLFLFLTINSLFGIITNRLNEQQRNYLSN